MYLLAPEDLLGRRIWVISSLSAARLVWGRQQSAIALRPDLLYIVQLRRMLMVIRYARRSGLSPSARAVQTVARSSQPSGEGADLAHIKVAASSRAQFQSSFNGLKQQTI